MIRKFQKRTRTIQAVQWTGSMKDVIELVGHDLPTYGEGRNGSLRISRLEGDIEVAPNDWIIRDMDELYSCNPYIFDRTYYEV
jgi:phage protein U